MVVNDQYPLRHAPHPDTHVIGAFSRKTLNVLRSH